MRDAHATSSCNLTLFGGRRCNRRAAQLCARLEAHALEARDRNETCFIEVHARRHIPAIECVHYTAGGTDEDAILVHLRWEATVLYEYVGITILQLASTSPQGRMGEVIVSKSHFPGEINLSLGVFSNNADIIILRRDELSKLLF